MSSGPCLNPNCKSQGRPHPNCHCYTGMAHGGDVLSVCATGKPHNKGCEYYAEGGDVDHAHSVAGYLAKHGLPGLLKLHEIDHPDKYQASVDSGHKHMEAYAKAIFTGEKSPKTDNSKTHKMIDDWLERGGLRADMQDEFHDQADPQAYAKGGEVKHRKPIHNEVVAEHHSDQNHLLQIAKARVGNYLHRQRPVKGGPKLAFDTEPDQTEEKKSYGKAREIAANPMSIMEHMHKGTLEPEHLNHFKAMYPELDDKMQRKLTDHIVKAQMDGKKPSYKSRQSLSMFMGAPMSADMTPQSIQAAQAVFAQQNQQKQQQAQPGQEPKPKKSTSSLTKSDQSFLTGNQALTARSQKQ